MGGFVNFIIANTESVATRFRARTRILVSEVIPDGAFRESVMGPDWAASQRLINAGR